MHRIGLLRIHAVERINAVYRLLIDRLLPDRRLLEALEMWEYAA